MAKINVLSFEIANLIAAGEVVERPSSVVKELIENSIDSGATSIVAEIKRGGVALIRVSDNGCGISRDDLPVAIRRHATSKISTKDDLDTIMTLGFRGEALAAISSVSSVTIITKTKDEEVGSMLVSEAGNVIDVSEVGTSDGTTVVVENLFYNVPARRKFLKKDATEAMNVTALVEKVALSRPDISIQLLIDGVEKFKTPGNNNLEDAVYSVFGKEFSSKLIKVDGEANGIKVHGFIGRSDNVRKNRNLQNVFINGRYVKSLTAMAAIEKAFTSFIAPECFPTCVLFVEMNPGSVDVNVHPAKLEVKFSNEQSVFEVIYYSVKRALEEFEYRPEMSLGAKNSKGNILNTFVPIGESTKGKQINFTENTVKRSFDTTPASKEVYKHESNAISANRFSEKNGKISNFDINRSANFSSRVSFPGGNDLRPQHSFSSEIAPKKSIEVLDTYKKTEPVVSAVTDNKSKDELICEEKVAQTTVTVPEYKFVGEVFETYIVIEVDEELIVIDKHAAHERIIFEDLKRSREKDGRIPSQSLLLPITVLLTADEIAAVRDYIDDFTGVGFEVCVNECSVDVTAIPDAMGIAEAEGLIVKMADDIIKGAGNPTLTEAIRREKSLYQIACKAAIKGGRNYDRTIVDWLIKKVLEFPDITVCPHGRPIAYVLTKRELDKQFNRIK